MYVEWTKHLKDQEEKSRFNGRILGARDVLERLADLIEEKEKSLDRSELTIETYSLPNWEHRQAHKNGNREAFAWLKKLVDLDHQKGNEV